MTVWYCNSSVLSLDKGMGVYDQWSISSALLRACLLAIIVCNNGF